MKKTFIVSAFLFTAFAMGACDDPASNAQATVTNLCEGTGGKLQDGKCVCSGETCERANWCDSNKKCSSDVELTPELLCVASGGVAKSGNCECSGTVCDDGLVCNLGSKKCPEKSEECKGSEGSEGSEDKNNCSTEIVFDSACKASGGSPAEGICVCSKVSCGTGVICNFDTKQCADKQISDGDKCDGNISYCQNDLDFVGTVTACDGTSFVSRACKDDKDNPVSCRGDKCGTCKNYDQLCVNQPNQIGAVQECQEGVPGKTIALCNDVSCRTDIPACGECLNGSLRCTEDNDNNAIMWRCVDGLWERIHNRFDPADELYACPAKCRQDAPSYEREYDCDTTQCDSCDPCWGSDRSTFEDINPCYDEERCKAIRAEEDKDYPPFRDYDTMIRLNDRRTVKEVFGYNFNSVKGGDVMDRVEKFDLDLTNGKNRVSCNADGTKYGQCHNSLQICINQSFHERGYIVQCRSGKLAEYDNNPYNDSNPTNKGDGIACWCERTENNSKGCCYTRNSCFKNTSVTSGVELCKKPEKNDSDNNYGY